MGEKGLINFGGKSERALLATVSIFGVTFKY